MLRKIEGGGLGNEKPAQVHVCSICKREGFWGEGWIWYGSYADLDDGKVRKACSEACADKLRKRVDREGVSRVQARPSHTTVSEPPRGKWERVPFATYADMRLWRCPLCGSLCGASLKWCEGDYFGLFDGDAPVPRHERVLRPRRPGPLRRLWTYLSIGLSNPSPPPLPRIPTDER